MEEKRSSRGRRDLCPQDGGLFNFLQYELAHSARLGIGSNNATRILAELVNMAQRDAGGTDGFWRQSAEMLIGHTLDVISSAGAMPSMLLANEIIASGPLSPDQVKDPQWQEGSKCWKLLALGRGRAGITHDFGLAETYWLQEFPRLPEKTRQSIVATFTASVAHHFCGQAMHQMFGGGTTVTLTYAAGKIVVVNLRRWITMPQAGSLNCVNICVQLALQRRVDRERPVFIFSDEAHHFVTEHDQLFQTTARSARCSVVYLTQNRSNYLAESPGSTGPHRVQSLSACLKTQIMHQCSHEETRRAFSDAIGKRRRMRLSTTHNFVTAKQPTPRMSSVGDEYWVVSHEATE